MMILEAIGQELINTTKDEQYIFPIIELPEGRG